MAYVDETSRQVDRERLDQFSKATVLSSYLDVVKKKLEGFVDNLERDFPGTMQRLYARLRDLLHTTTTTRLDSCAVLTLN